MSSCGKKVERCGATVPEQHNKRSLSEHIGIQYSLWARDGIKMQSHIPMKPRYHGYSVCELSSVSESLSPYGEEISTTTNGCNVSAFCIWPLSHLAHCLSFFLYLFLWFFSAFFSFHLLISSCDHPFASHSLSAFLQPSHIQKENQMKVTTPPGPKLLQ